MKTKQEADQYLKNYIESNSKMRMRASEISDFELTGEEDEREIEEIADEYISDCQDDLDEWRATQQDIYDERNGYAIRQSEMIERFRNEY